MQGPLTCNRKVTCRERHRESPPNTLRLAPTCVHPSATTRQLPCSCLPSPPGPRHAVSAARLSAVGSAVESAVESCWVSRSVEGEQTAAFAIAAPDTAT
eukprot:364311-Chlamydomonas_euryale.AAC.9